MKLFCDLHIHTALSPCADDEMTPNNIVNMATLKELDVIAVTDHNATKNAAAVVACAAAVNPSLVVVPGMELETQENIHMVCLFPSVDAAQKAGDTVYRRLPEFTLDPYIYGRQLILDKDDTVTGEETRLLSTATDLTVEEAISLVHGLGGVIYPAHIDREANGMLGVFGTIPPELDFCAAELSPRASKDLQNEVGIRYNIICSSDAHTLEQIQERVFSLDVSTFSVGGVLKAVKSLQKRQG